MSRGDQESLDDAMGSAWLDDYDRFVESMAVHCRCTRDSPCAGVLAGGMCDGIVDEDLDDWDEDYDEYEDWDDDYTDE